MYVVGANRVRPFVCNAYDCTQFVQGSIHNYNHIKTYVIKQNISSRRAADDRPYGFTFINYYLNGKILPLPVVEPILQSVRLAFTERRYNFPLSIFNFQFKKNLPNTANAIFGRIFYLFTYSLCTSFSFVPVINYGQQLYKPAHFESPRSMPIQSVPVSKTINVVDYGACPDDNKNDWPAICRALAECERSGGGVRILFPKGIYQIKVGERKSKLTHAFSLSNVSDFIIEGDGAILILENPDVALMTLKNCQAGVIKGLTIDYKTLPFTQGAVVDVDINGKTFTFRSDGKGGRPTDDNFAKSKTKWGVLFDRENNRLLKDKAPNLVPIREVSNLGDKNLFRIVTTLFNCF